MSHVRLAALLGLVGLLFGCPAPEPDEPATPPAPLDSDGDGFDSEQDCDDTNAGIFPGARDQPYDGVDQDCDGVDPVDLDGDGFASDVVDGGLDCDDSDPEVRPGVSDPPYDGVDQDCDGLDPVDLDSDGYPASEVTGGTDCADQDPAIHPGAAEVAYDGVDQDCDGEDLVDVDADGHDAEVAGGHDCDDEDGGVNPAAAEVPYDGVDQDCSGDDLVDVDLDGHEAIEAGGGDCDDDDDGVHPDAIELPYDGVDQDCDGADITDDDADGFDAVAAGGGDCDDADPAIHPGAVELPYDGVDQDCSGADLTDQDGDGFDGTEAGGTDCEDADAAINPAAPDQPYDGVDQDCDGFDLTDVDGDGFDSAVLSGGLDCDDFEASAHPGAAEVPYDGVDQDCDGADLLDVDGDGFVGAAAGGDDCDDGDPLAWPGATEEPDDGVDQDCDGSDYTGLDYLEDTTDVVVPPVDPSAPTDVDSSGAEILLDHVFVVFENAVDEEAIAASVGASVTGVLPGIGRVLTVVSPDAAAVEALVATLEANVGVVSAAPIHAGLVALADSDVELLEPEDSYGFDQIGWQAAWDAIDDAGVTLATDVHVAVLDSEFDLNHPELEDAFLEELNGMPAFDWVEWDTDVTTSSPLDPNAHGTHVSGIIAAAIDDGGINGVAPGVGILPFRVVGGGELELSFAIWAAVAAGVDIINISAGFGVSGLLSDWQGGLLHSTVVAAAEADVVVIAAAGNAGAPVNDLPAGFSEVISIGATNQAGGRYVNEVTGEASNWSDQQTLLSLAAPGDAIWSTGYDAPFSDAYTTFFGTSQAAPFVSGLAALVLQVEPSFPRGDLEDLLRDHAEPIIVDTDDGPVEWLRIDAAATIGYVLDDDGDEFSEWEGDCDDDNGDVSPAADEQDNEQDDDCDGDIDEDFVDGDGDEVTEADGDCDDTTPLVAPGLPEVPDDLDNDCDGEVDEDELWTPWPLAFVEDPYIEWDTLELDDGGVLHALSRDWGQGDYQPRYLRNDGAGWSFEALPAELGWPAALHVEPDGTVYLAAAIQMDPFGDEVEAWRRDATTGVWELELLLIESWQGIEVGSLAVALDPVGELAFVVNSSFWATDGLNYAAFSSGVYGCCGSPELFFDPSGDALILSLYGDDVTLRTGTLGPTDSWFFSTGWVGEADSYAVEFDSAGLPRMARRDGSALYLDRYDGAAWTTSTTYIDSAAGVGLALLAGDVLCATWHHDGFDTFRVTCDDGATTWTDVLVAGPSSTPAAIGLPDGTVGLLRHDTSTRAAHWGTYDPSSGDWSAVSSFGDVGSVYKATGDVLGADGYWLFREGSWAGNQLLLEHPDGRDLVALGDLDLFSDGLVVESSALVHAVWQEEPAVRYGVGTPGGTWAAPQTIGQGSGACSSNGGPVRDLQIDRGDSGLLAVTYVDITGCSNPNNAVKATFLEPSTTQWARSGWSTSSEGWPASTT